MKRTIKLILFNFFVLFSLVAKSQNTEVKDSTKIRQINTAKPANIKCLVPPIGFDTLTGLNGYYHKQIGGSIVLSLVDGKTVKDAELAFNDQHIKNIKNQLISKSKLTLDDGNEMLVYQLTYEFNGETWGRYQAFVGDDKSTLWIVISYPYRFNQEIEGVLLKSLRSTKFAER
jgi:hypothetical protein